MSIRVTTIKPEFVDERGFISRIIDPAKIEIKSVLIISSKANTVRGNHYHKKDSHYVYCLSGKFKYSEWKSRKNLQKKQGIILTPGTLVLTPPKIWHSMEFFEDSIFLAFTSETRLHSKYEKDTVRIQPKG